MRRALLGLVAVAALMVCAGTAQADHYRYYHPGHQWSGMRSYNYGLGGGYVLPGSYQYRSYHSYGPVVVQPRIVRHPTVIVPFPGHPPVVHPPIVHPPVVRHYGYGGGGFSYWGPGVGVSVGW